MKTAIQAATNLLSYRDHSALELKQKLIKSGFQAQEADLAIAELKKAKLLNEQNFAENYIYFRKQKGYGPQRIEQELQNKGIESEIIAHAFEISDNDWQLHAKEAWLKKFGGQAPKDIKEKSKQIRFLQYRGFSHEQINNLIK